jgi:hypothetical protein
VQRKRIESKQQNIVPVTSGVLPYGKNFDTFAAVKKVNEMFQVASIV